MRANEPLSSVEAEQELSALGGVPIDRIAWRVIQKGEHFVPKKNITQLVFDCAPPTRGMRRNPWEQRPENLRGRKVGRLEVVGYWGPKVDERGRSKGGSVNQLWVCRCPCGIYVTRTAKTIKAQRDPDDKCEYCRHLAYLKRDEFYRAHGYDEDAAA